MPIFQSSNTINNRKGIMALLKHSCPITERPEQYNKIDTKENDLKMTS